MLLVRGKSSCLLSLLSTEILNLWRSYACSQSLCEFIGESVLLCLDNAVLIHHLWLLQSSCLLFPIDLWTSRGEINLKHLIWSWVLRSLSLSVQLWVSVLITICCKKTLLWWGLIDILFYEYSSMSFRSHFILVSLYRMIVVGFSLEFMT